MTSSRGSSRRPRVNTPNAMPHHSAARFRRSVAAAVATMERRRRAERRQTSFRPRLARRSLGGVRQVRPSRAHGSRTRPAGLPPRVSARLTLTFVATAGSDTPSSSARGAVAGDPSISALGWSRAFVATRDHSPGDGADAAATRRRRRSLLAAPADSPHAAVARVPAVCPRPDAVPYASPFASMI